MYAVFSVASLKGNSEIEETYIMSPSARPMAIARFYTKPAWQQTVRDLFEVESVQVYGLKSDVVPLPHSRFKLLLESLLPDRVARIFTHHFRAGTFLVAKMRASKSE